MPCSHSPQILKHRLILQLLFPLLLPLLLRLLYPPPHRKCPVAAYKKSRPLKRHKLTNHSLAQPILANQNPPLQPLLPTLANQKLTPPLHPPAKPAPIVLRYLLCYNLSVWIMFPKFQILVFKLFDILQIVVIDIEVSRLAIVCPFLFWILFPCYRRRIYPG